MDPHFVCPVCGGVSPTAKSCDTEGCTVQGQPLKPCACSDDKHESIIGKQLQPGL